MNYREIENLNVSIINDISNIDNKFNIIFQINVLSDNTISIEAECVADKRRRANFFSIFLKITELRLIALSQSLRYVRR